MSIHYNSVIHSHNLLRHRARDELIAGVIVQRERPRLYKDKELKARERQTDPVYSIYIYHISEHCENDSQNK